MSYNEPIPSRHEAIEEAAWGLYLDFLDVLLEEAKPSRAAVEALSDWGSLLHRYGVLNETEWKRARKAVRALGGSVSEE